MGHPDHIVNYQHLPVHAISGTDSNYRYCKTFSYFFSEFGRNFFQNKCEATGFFQH